jgi:hypothetical protein
MPNIDFNATFQWGSISAIHSPMNIDITVMNSLGFESTYNFSITPTNSTLVPVPIQDGFDTGSILSVKIGIKNRKFGKLIGLSKTQWDDQEFTTSVVSDTLIIELSGTINITESATVWQSPVTDSIQISAKGEYIKRGNRETGPGVAIRLPVWNDNCEIRVKSFTDSIWKQDPTVSYSMDYPETFATIDFEMSGNADSQIWVKVVWRFISYTDTSVSYITKWYPVPFVLGNSFITVSPETQGVATLPAESIEVDEEIPITVKRYPNLTLGLERRVPGAPVESVAFSATFYNEPLYIKLETKNAWDAIRINEINYSQTTSNVDLNWSDAVAITTTWKNRFTIEILTGSLWIVKQLEFSPFPPARIKGFSADRYRLSAGESVKLQWSIEHAESVVLIPPKTDSQVGSGTDAFPTGPVSGETVPQVAVQPLPIALGTNQLQFYPIHSGEFTLEVRNRSGYDSRTVNLTLHMFPYKISIVEPRADMESTVSFEFDIYPASSYAEFRLPDTTGIIQIPSNWSQFVTVAEGTGTYQLSINNGGLITIYEWEITCNQKQITSIIERAPVQKNIN